MCKQPVDSTDSSLHSPSRPLLGPVGEYGVVSSQEVMILKLYYIKQSLAFILLSASDQNQSILSL